MKNVQEAYNKLSVELRVEFDSEMSDFEFSLEDIANPQSGKISEIFGAGGGTQIKFAASTNWYEKLGLLKEIS